MLDADRRLFVMAENRAGAAPWYHDGFAFTQETPYSFASADDFTCRENRGEPTSPLFLVNHFVTPPSPTEADRANARPLLAARLAQCQRERELLPNLVAVDFFARGDVLAVVDELNGVATA